MVHDLLIVGGGINGTAIAREAALNGLSVLLVEKDDLAAHTSSASTKLIHGGLRYLEYYEFRLVREALKERELLLHAAPHLIRPMQFVLPHAHAVRPWWLVRLGLLLYDTIGGRSSLPRSRGDGLIDAKELTAQLKNPLGHHFFYWDCAVDDARLTLFNAVDAAANGAEIATRTALLRADIKDRLCHAMLSDGRTIMARAVVNAAGPWVEQLLHTLGADGRNRIRLVRGSHIIVPRLFAGEHAYMLQQPDRRIVFAIPYGHDSTLIGTTDIAVDTPEQVAISEEEISYLCAAANRYFARQIAPGDVVATYSGVRPLYDDGTSDAKAVTRDYVLELDDSGAPLLSVFGGKITTARHLAEEALGKLGPVLELTPRVVTRARAFPGGDIAHFSDFLAEVRTQWPFLGDARAERMARAYGTLLRDMLAEVAAEADMGEDLGAGLTEIELEWMVTREWARAAEDILWRRSKLGLGADPSLERRVTEWLSKRARSGFAPPQPRP
ncbi:glycerol-3-phosphate dehydrogenase [Sphingomonas sp. LaA6.9]|uniref:glycerol-3-phosphate dehydrogenase n=1 Tax=Sphingomonas sp. LaA6.9 TaxID=2919914 RepID=UPI001F503EE4|nr:glycerol-3-phosphate dehydrogenase [Sphingomonas sp. LaA6.9]MCJ8155953.1 glycerol-3-phosphate dehydrogenase [Sphingomonas sp. LaA6.9]